MDQRKEQLKALKKAYTRKKRKSVGIWRLLAVIFLLLSLIAACILFVPLVPVMLLVLLLPEAATAFLADNLWLFSAVLGGSSVLFVLFSIVAGCRKRKVKKSSEYLDYRTLENYTQSGKRKKQIKNCHPNGQCH